MDQSHVAQVTLTKQASGSEAEQTLVISVTLSIGDVRSVAAQASPALGQSLYLLVIMRQQ